MADDNEGNNGIKSFKVSKGVSNGTGYSMYTP